MVGKSYRRAVVGVFVNTSNEVLVCERSDCKNVWQFPQGGVEENESLQQGLFREMKEELGTDEFSLVQESPFATNYDFPEDLKAPITEKFNGQTLHWFLLKFVGGAAPRFEHAEDKEFVDYKWVDWKEAVDGVTDWKKDAYIEGLENLGFK